MKLAKVDYKVKIYQDTGHAFFNDSNPGAYNHAAATDAWNEVMVELSKI
jgi:carboxymethylenebutenolidase